MDATIGVWIDERVATIVAKSVEPDAITTVSGLEQHIFKNTRLFVLWYNSDSDVSSKPSLDRRVGDVRRVASWSHRYCSFYATLSSVFAQSCDINSDHCAG
jgi:hypothetical protein